MDQLTLFELNNLIRATLDTHLDPSYWVIAEIGSLQVNQKGHCYMELVQKEEDLVKAKIRANIWAYTYRKLGSWFEGITGIPLKTGLKVLLNVSVQFHELYGMSLNVRDIDPNFTMGERARKRQEIINRLINEGLFDRNKTKFLPLAPQRVAVISSSSAAGYGDFINQLSDNQYGYTLDVTLFNSIMQGFEAEKSIISSLEEISKIPDAYDVIVIVRGGGSQVDMDCFDSYELSKGVASMPIPVITGIGHERDESITDMVAHTHLRTPTAVGEFLISGLAQFEGLLEEYRDRLKRKFEKLMYNEDTKLRTFQHQIRQFVFASFQKHAYNLDYLYQKMKDSTSRYFEKHYQELAHQEAAINLLDPESVLQRGYTITTYNGKILKKKTKIKKGDNLKTYSKYQIIDSKITSVNEKK